MNLNKFTRLKAAAARHQQEIDRAAGAYDQLIKRLKEFGVTDIKAAITLRKKLTRRRTMQERDIANRLARIEKRYGSLLEQTETD